MKPPPTTTMGSGDQRDIGERTMEASTGMGSTEHLDAIATVDVGVRGGVARKVSALTRKRRWRMRMRRRAYGTGEWTGTPHLHTDPHTQVTLGPPWLCSLGLGHLGLLTWPACLTDFLPACLSVSAVAVSLYLSSAFPLCYQALPVYHGYS